MAKPYKWRKRGKATGQHVQLHEWFQASEAWATLRPGPRALYIEMKRRFNGTNNGQIFLSYRDAAEAVHAHRNTVGSWFRELEARGFIRLTVGPHLGPSGIGEASVWALEELPTSDGKLAGKAFMRWSEKEKPRTKIVPARHKKQDAA
jgi:DNA-binding transcriptional MocR family regulator